MDNLDTHSEHVDQPEGQQANGLPFAVQTSQVLDSDVVGQPHINLSPFWSILEQHRLQLDRVLQPHVHNEQVRMSLQQEISTQNATLLNLLESVTRDVMNQSNAEIATLRRVLQRTQEDLETTRDVMNQGHVEIATLCRVLQRTQEDLETTQYHVGEVFEHAVSAYEVALIFMLAAAAVQQETNSHVSSNELEDETSSVARTAEETTKCDLICKVCNSGGACMLLLPCHHLCACEPCGGHLVACPICGVVKDEAIQFARSG